MRKLLNRPWFVVLLALVALYGVSDFLFFRGPAENFDVAPAEEPAEVARDGEAAGPAPLRLAPAAALRALPIPAHPRDLFAPLPKPEAPVVAGKPADVVRVAGESVERFLLTAIWTQNQITWVLLNGRICQVGDTVGRCRIETATQEGVWLRHAQGREQVLLGREFLLRSSSNAAPPAADTPSL